MSSYSNNFPEACFWALFVHYFSVLFCLQLVSNRRRRLAGELPANLRILTTNFYLRTKNNLKSFILELRSIYEHELRIFRSNLGLKPRSRGPHS